MTTIMHRFARTTAVAVALTALGGCSQAGSLGNVLGSVLGGGQTAGSQVSGTIQNVDTRNQQINLRQSNGQGVSLVFDQQTKVVYQNQSYGITSLEYGDQVTARRTAAASALAASFLARADARRLLVVGAGRVARLLPAAYRVVRPIEQVTVWARRPQEAEALAHALADGGVAAAASTDLAGAVAAADVVSVATLATEPVIEGRWLRPGSHLDLIGSFTPAMREADDACFAGAAVYVDTEEALQKSGDLLGPLRRGVFITAGVRGTLATLARGEAQGRRDETERTVFKSVGTALEDLAAAILVHEQG